MIRHKRQIGREEEERGKTNGKRERAGIRCVVENAGGVSGNHLPGFG